MKTVFKFFGIAGACTLGTLAALHIYNSVQASQALSYIGTPKSAGIIQAESTGPQGTGVDFRAASKKILQSVVSIDASGKVENVWGETFVRAFGSGTGVVISSKGHIITNNHVISNPNNGGLAEFVKVHLANGDVAAGKVIGNDPRSDLAVIKVDRTDLVPVEFGSIKTLEVGQWVIAAGSPLGYDNTVSVGVISSLGRAVDLSEAGAAQRGGAPFLVNAIQTDAAINPGNSGGALCDTAGNLVGINTVIATNTGTNVGIGFAIPVDRVQRVANDIIQYGRVRYGVLGIVEDQFPGRLKYENVRNEIKGMVGAAPPEDGIIIVQVAPDSPAAKIGMERLSILVQIDNMPIKLPIDLRKALADKSPGETIQVKYWKKGKIVTSPATLQELANN
ncbi:MAG: trypsin-like peptidase domain-containing protein [Chthonomonas sp.]|nr:trypsin-like peptidase domain-containing protein [Chthonomonas sp.]